jgi:hypothetical protein
MRYDVILLALCVLLAPITPAHSQTATDELIDQLRRDALENLNPDSLGAGYAAMLSLAVSPDISAATFYPDPGAGIDDTRLKVFKLPIRHVFNREGEGVRPFVQGLFAYQTLDAEFNVLIDESIRSDWRTVVRGIVRWRRDSATRTVESVDCGHIWNRSAAKRGRI